MSGEIEIRFVQPSGAMAVAHAAAGISVMRAALDNGIPGIIAECGGDCACATCHVYVDGDFADRLRPPNDIEREMLEGVAAEISPHSRLSCQIRIDTELDGLTVRIPPTQC